MKNTNNICNYTVNTILKHLYTLVVVNDGIQSYLVEALNALFDKLVFSLDDFNSCYYYNHSRETVTYYGDDNNPSMLSTFSQKHVIVNKPVITYQLASNYYQYKMDAIANQMKENDAKALKVANDLVKENEKKRKQQSSSGVTVLKVRKFR